MISKISATVLDRTLIVFLVFKENINTELLVLINGQGSGVKRAYPGFIDFIKKNVIQVDESSSRGGKSPWILR